MISNSISSQRKFSSNFFQGSAKPRSWGNISRSEGALVTFGLYATFRLKELYLQLGQAIDLIPSTNDGYPIWDTPKAGTAGVLTAYNKTDLAMNLSFGSCP